MIPLEKQRELERVVNEHKLVSRERELEKEEMSLPTSESPLRIPPPLDVFDDARARMCIEDSSIILK